jgi:4-carboxymuconolactone decarboxylase
MAEAGFRERAEKIYERRGLAKRIRHLCFVSVLTLLGRTDELRESLHWAIERRVAVTDLRECLLQTCLFAGFPRTIHGFEVLDDVLAERGVAEPHRSDRSPPRASLRTFFRRRGRELFRKVYGSDTEIVTERISRFHPEFMEIIVESAYGRVLGRPFLDLKTREILAVSMLAVLELPRQLTPHLRGALRAGAKGREVREALRQLEPFVPNRVVRAALVRLERAQTSL